MATTVVNPPSNNGMGFLIGVLVIVAIAVLFFVYGLPYLQGMKNNGVQVNVPKNIDVNVKQSK